MRAVLVSDVLKRELAVKERCFRSARKSEKFLLYYLLLSKLYNQYYRCNQLMCFFVLFFFTVEGTSGHDDTALYSELFPAWLFLSLLEVRMSAL